MGPRLAPLLGREAEAPGPQEARHGATPSDRGLVKRDGLQQSDEEVLRRVEDEVDGGRPSTFADSPTTDNWAPSWASTVSAHDTFRSRLLGTRRPYPRTRTLGAL
eukprot:12917764-Alexandrium_andersonii.AAC.1